MATLALAAFLSPATIKPKPHPPIAWSVTPVAIIRTTADILDPDRKPYQRWLRRRAGLQVLLRFNGPEKIRAFTRFRITHAGVNTGVNLRLLSPKPDAFVQPGRSRLGKIARQAALPGRILPVLFALPPTKAKVLTRLVGQSDLVVGGHVRLVELKHLQAMHLGPVKLPRTLFPHVNLRLLQKPKPGKTGIVTFELGGAPAAFRSASVVDKGRKISRGYLAIGPPARAQKILLFLRHPLGSGAELKLRLLVDQKIMAVRFSLHPIQLPP
jgi:hypothetical protein